MTEIITIKGLDFAIEAHGLTRYEADRDAIVSGLWTRLNDLAEADLAALHAGSVFSDDGPVDDDAVHRLQVIANDAKAEVCADWNDASNVFVSVSAVPA